MRFGGPVFDWASPEEWISELKANGYEAAYCPVDEKADSYTIAAFHQAAKSNNILIAEVGAWVNVLDADPAKRKANIDLCKARLALADKIEARCCVNISGSRGTPWDGPDLLNYSAETFDWVVETTREIIDAIKPSRTKYSIETMPWMVPDSADSALELVNAVNRSAFSIHYDPINLIVSPRQYFHTGAMVEEFLRKVGPHICAIHLKDNLIDSSLTLHIREVRPGAGGFDLRAFLKLVNRYLDADMPVMLEHLADASEYVLAREHVVSVANELRISSFEL